MLVSIQYCPMCGEKFKIHTNVTDCSDERHAVRRKDRDSFCYDCGVSLSASENPNSTKNKNY